MHMANGVLFAKRMIRLLKEFSVQKEVTPDEFIDVKLKSGTENNDFTELCENFLILMKHDTFFNVMVEKFWSYYGLQPFNKGIITTLMYIIIFGLDDENCLQTVDVFTKLNYRFSLNVIDYFILEDNIVDVTQVACNMFDNEYVLKYILHPILNKKNLIEKVHYLVGQKIATKQRIPSKPLTKPNPPACFIKTKRIPSPPLNTPIEFPKFKSNAVPKTVLQRDLKFQECLEKAHEDNKEKALKLLEAAQKKPFKCAGIQKKTATSFEKLPVSNFKPSKVPPKKDVIIKRNAASLMREAATLVKDKESEIKRIEALTQMVFDPNSLETLEDNIRKCKEQQHLQDIERKHLQGQITDVEAILARQNLIKVNQEKMEEFKQERVSILEEIDRWRQKEQEKIRALVERCQNIEKAAKDAGRKMQENKKTQARLVESETKELLKEAYTKKQEELTCKVRLIQELRALQQVRSIQVKEFDPTESPNFGLLCEMSIAELQERLVLLKMELQEELQKRRQTIAESRQKQQELIVSVKQFIGQSRVAKLKPVPRSASKLEQTPEIIALRERLQQARHLRINAQQSSVYI